MTIMDLYDVMRTTHAVRGFTDEPQPTTRSIGSSTTHASPPAGATGKEPTSLWCVMPKRGSDSPNSASPAPVDTSPS